MVHLMLYLCLAFFAGCTAGVAAMIGLIWLAGSEDEPYKRLGDPP